MNGFLGKQYGYSDMSSMQLAILWSNMSTVYCRHIAIISPQSICSVYIKARAWRRNNGVLGDFRARPTFFFCVWRITCWVGFVHRIEQNWVGENMSIMLQTISFSSKNHLWCICYWSFSIRPLLTHWRREKWPPYSRRHFEIHFLEWKCMNFDQNFTEVCS